MRTIYLVRHAESRSQSEDDDDYLNPGLSELGMRQAERLIEPLKQLHFDAIFISPLRRTTETFQISRAEAPRIEFDSRLVEVVPGYERILPLMTPDCALPDRHNAWLQNANQRCTDLLDDILAGPEASVLMFGHGGIFSYFFKAFIDCANNDFFIMTDNTGISKLEAGGEIDRMIRYWNRTAHAADLLP
jgi:broad specificity phosphatase PhoE